MSDFECGYDNWNNIEARLVLPFIRKPRHISKPQLRSTESYVWHTTYLGIYSIFYIFMRSDMYKKKQDDTAEKITGNRVCIRALFCHLRQRIIISKCQTYQAII